MRGLGVAVVVALVVAGCSSDGTDAPDATTTSAAAATTTSSPAATTTLVASTTTTSPAPPTTSTTTVPPAPEFTVDLLGFFPAPLAGSGGAHGSGCSAGAGPLPDGVWFGSVEGVDDGSVTFDRACFFTGEAAVNAAADDGIDDIGDFYIRNANPSIRVVATSPTGTAYWIDSSGDVTSPLPVPMGDWPVTSGTPYVPCPGEFCSAWLFVNGGVATELVEQYLP
ncbi:MAG: hypothetical protein R2823_02705 [Acidimicrobiia bacterium]